MSLRIAVLVKQVPRFEDMALGPDGRLRRDGAELEMNPYCRRAVSKGVELAQQTGGTCTVFTMGPPAAEDVLREAVAWGADHGVLVTDPAFAGADTLATAHALAAALRWSGPFDLVLTGRNSVDADTGQVGAELAELLDLPMLAGVKTLEIAEGGATARAHCEHDDGWLEAEADLPLVVSCAERLCEPAKVDPPGRAAVPADRLTVVHADDLGPGPWGAAASPTRVGDIRTLEVHRAGRVLEGPLREQVAEAVRLLTDDGALGRDPRQGTAFDPDDIEVVADGWARGLLVIGVVLEPERARASRSLLGAAASLAATLGGRVVALSASPELDLALLGTWGADHVVCLHGTQIEEDVARAIAGWCDRNGAWAVLASGTMWGREVASRIAARLGAGLTGDAVDLTIEAGRLVGWKPAFGGRLVAAITATSPVQMVTVRPGVLTQRSPRAGALPTQEQLAATTTGRIRHLDRGRDDELDALAQAQVVVGVGRGVDPDAYHELDPLVGVLGAELAATRKVTDNGWLPRSRQIGITGRSVSPKLYVALGVSGKFNHLSGVRAAGQILAVNLDRTAPVFDGCDIGLVADWREVVPLLVAEITGANPTPVHR